MKWPAQGIQCRRRHADNCRESCNCTNLAMVAMFCDRPNLGPAERDSEVTTCPAAAVWRTIRKAADFFMRPCRRIFRHKTPPAYSAPTWLAQSGLITQRVSARLRPLGKPHRVETS